MKAVLAVIVGAALLIGCGVLERSAEFVERNPIVADLAMEQAVARYISAGKTEQDWAQRAEAVSSRMALAERYLQGDPSATVAELVGVVEASIDWGSLSPGDRQLVRIIMRLAQEQLEQAVADGYASGYDTLAVRQLIETAGRTAQLFL